MDAKQEHELDEMATIIILRVFQSWGQPLEERKEVLKKAIDFCGIRVTVVSLSQDRKRCEFVSEDYDEAKKALDFYEELQSCFPLGKFEHEREAIKKVLIKYKKPA